LKNIKQVNELASRHGVPAAEAAKCLSCHRKSADGAPKLKKSENLKMQRYGLSRAGAGR
jgi:hypothetical protein